MRSLPPSPSMTDPARMAFLLRSIEVEINYLRAQRLSGDSPASPPCLLPDHAPPRKGPPTSCDGFDKMLSLLLVTHNDITRRMRGLTLEPATTRASSLPVKSSGSVLDLADADKDGEVDARPGHGEGPQADSVEGVEEYLAKRVQGFHRRLQKQKLGKGEAGRLVYSLARMEGARARRILVLQNRAAAVGEAF